MPELELLQVRSEFDPVVDIYRDMSPERVLEIGCWDGLSLRTWLTEANPKVVVAVDLEHRNRGDYAKWIQSGTSLHPYTGSSLEQEQIDAMRSHAPYDWAFVDGDHSPEGVRSDVDVCLPLIRSGGLLLLHDITPPAGYDYYPPGVLLDELERQQGYRVERFEDPKPEPWSHGIGVVYL